ncbi:hypothetical protein EOPP23_20505 [Endozoicomonas sp. OPT23]|uniref:YihY family inner membrane protein n=1 Tax=Endozoicomonas sp. OPT23 TaxID=2072845 RepID=UPI00129A535A|nr:YihY family inner membrane protein [Endozoicomonas sp. OPT23]MRI35344.1 hypothetical protein [Endozoicomonas sp. OPT23]
MSKPEMAKSSVADRLLAAGEYLKTVFELFLRNRSLDNAAALTYTTLFAVVPMMTVTYSALSAIPSFQGVSESIQSFVFSNFVPATGEQIQSYLGSFSQQARKLTGVGILFLVVTAFLMLRTIDRSINQIWQVEQVRRGVSGFLLYWAILSLGPFMIGAGFVLTSYLASLKLVSDTTAYLGVDQWLLRLMPVFLSSLVFTLLYTAVPNRKVPLKHALFGAVVVAVLIELAKGGFALFITLSPSYQLIYGAFAAVPLFLLWIYMSWIMVLFGAALVRGLAIKQTRGEERLPEVLGVLAVLSAFKTSFAVGSSLKLVDLHKMGWKLSLQDWEFYTEGLMEAGLITRNDRASLILAKDLETLSLNELCQQLGCPIPEVSELQGRDLQSRPEWFRQSVERFLEVNRQKSTVLDIQLSALLTSKR